ncbi:hypothetical protein [Thiothrix eikelboomii]|uniref:hypothetical protein n=1 Tax=Thiothrix eikelboomii TaxID=92487 RepID=UPI003BAF975C
MRRGKKHSPKWGGGQFVALPHTVLKSDKFASLSPVAVKLMLDLLSQYDGKNNGDLCAAYSVMQKRGWSSKSNLAKALKELMDNQFIVLSEQGGRHKPTLYAITFYAVDECSDKKGISKHSLRPTSAPSNDWMQDMPAQDIKAAQVEKRKAQIIEMQEYLANNPDDRYASNIKRGIDEMNTQLTKENKKAAP